MCNFYLARSMDLMHGGCLSCINGKCTNYLSDRNNKKCTEVGLWFVISDLVEDQTIIITGLRRAGVL